MIISFVLIGVVYASSKIDEEILKNLDFYISMEVIEGEQSVLDMYEDDDTAELLEQNSVEANTNEINNEIEINK